MGPQELLLNAILDRILPPNETIEEALQRVPESDRNSRRKFACETGCSPINDLRYYDWIRSQTLPRRP